jgi:hypothetical protein
MQAILFGLFDFVAKNKWAQWLLVGLLIICTLGFYLAWRDNDVRKRERQKRELEEAKQRVEMVERKTAIVEKERINAQEAITARDTDVGFPDYDSLPESHKAIAEGRAGPR